MIYESIPTAKAIDEFFNNLILAIEGIQKERLVPTLKMYLMAICQALEAKWAGVLQYKKEEWVVLTKTESYPEIFPPKQLTALLKRLVDKNEPQTLASQEEIEKYLSNQGITNLAIIPFNWALEPEDQRLLVVGDKKAQIGPGGDLPYYVTPLLRFLAGWFALLTKDIQNYFDAWEKALYGGSRKAILKRARDLLSAHGPGISEDVLDRVKASEIDSSVLLEILRHDRIATGEIAERESSKRQVNGSGPGPFSRLATIREKAWRRYNENRIVDETVVKETLKDLSELWPPKVCFKATTHAPEFKGAVLNNTMTQKLWMFTQSQHLQMECLRTYLFVLHYSATGMEGMADTQSIGQCNCMFVDKVLGNRFLSESLSEFVKGFLDQWQGDDKQDDLVISTEWLVMWFGLKLLDSVEMSPELHFRHTPNASALFYRHFTAFFLYILHVIRCFGEPTLFRFSDVEGGYEAFVDATLFLLADYTHQVEGLPRRIPLYKIMSEIWSSEAVLYTVREGYRDHLHHVLNVTLLGMVLMDAGLIDRLNAVQHHSGEEGCRRRRRNWILAGLLHDVGYKLDLNRHLIPHLHFLRGSPCLTRFVEELGLAFKCSEQRLCDSLNQWFSFGSLSNKVDHGIVSAMYLLFLDQAGQDIKGEAKPSTEWYNDIDEAFEAIGKHNLPGIDIIPQHSPLAFLLLLCDLLQEWDRPRPESEKLRRSVSTLLHRHREGSASGSRVVRCLCTNLRWEGGKIKMCTNKPLRLSLHCNDASLEHFEPALIWCLNTYDLQRIDLKKWPENFSILFDMVHKLSDDLYKKPSFLEMDLFEDFVREDQKSLSLISWIQEARSTHKRWHYEKSHPGDERPVETFTWTFEQCDTKPILDRIPPELYKRYVCWKDTYLRNARLRVKIE